ncbi:RDD family protein [Acanthopleuribacter pedis]|uniref:RDD family protein n=1 Tax=Acanthopleuribacter pedis TaxID=442870 RepID=A0A8J7U482_9BACT|nr:RDD family protein [Acanthopleuribacter pedis]MBO1321213.1 RDD family protein [Acanthopleuribacter pedis]
MNVCFVCGASLDPEKTECPQCATPVQELGMMLRVSQKSRFLFGSRKQAGLPTSVGATPSQPPPAAPAKKPKVAKPFVAETQIDALDLIRNRDPIIEEEKTGEDVIALPITQRAPAHLADVALVSLFNGVILQIILWFSHRGLQDLVTFSLLPILFVLLSFTFLYFWLFLGLFKKTLGALLIEYYQKNAG